VRLADLYCGGGGAAMGYHRAGFEVVGFDKNPQPHYPFAFVQADCLALCPTWLWANFHAAHASPPCQRYSEMAQRHGNSGDHPDLIEPTRAQLLASGLPFILENVTHAPIRQDVTLCGTMFGLRIVKHRHFECSFKARPASGGCDHRDVYDPWHGAGRTAARMREAMGIDWLPQQGGASRLRGTTGDLFNAIPPAYTEFLGGQLMDHLLHGDLA
jgi:DNA (cytosine-5)-methyltransferase 1